MTMDSWVLQPEHDRLPLSDDQWVLVRRRLNAGEYRAHLKRSSHENGDGNRHIDELDYGHSLVVSYLIDWSLVDPSGHAISLRDDIGRPADAATISSIVDNLDADRFMEIKRAIEAHVAKQDAAREAEKKTGGRMTPAPTSPSQSDVGGGSPGSASSTETSAIF